MLHVGPFEHLFHVLNMRHISEVHHTIILCSYALCEDRTQCLATIKKQLCTTKHGAAMTLCVTLSACLHKFSLRSLLVLNEFYLQKFCYFQFKHHGFKPFPAMSSADCLKLTTWQFMKSQRKWQWWPFFGIKVYNCAECSAWMCQSQDGKCMAQHCVFGVAEVTERAAHLCV